MHLDSGVYKIHNGGDMVGRARNETMDLSPKPVFNKTDDEDATWTVEPLPNGRYMLYVKEGPAAVGDGRPTKDVVSLVQGGQDAVEWELHPVDGTDGRYRIMSPEGGVWAVSEPGKHCRIGVLPAGSENGDSTTFTFTSVES
ncbi:I66 family serine proteinase inhibitor [Streptomyces sp. NPDC057249]|uniref:I66 family serine proteinase inhibitor n=1 Tax=Streptomyces sp. NPDC057249 TaxID=3346067 RepID=UPI00362C0154